MRILSGVFEDRRSGGQVTTGTPIAMIVDNVDQRPRDYSDIAARFRPGLGRCQYGPLRRRLGIAAGITDTAKMRPADRDEEPHSAAEWSGLERTRPARWPEPCHAWESRYSRNRKTGQY